MGKNFGMKKYIKEKFETKQWKKEKFPKKMSTILKNKSEIKEFFDKKLKKISKHLILNS